MVCGASSRLAPVGAVILAALCGMLDAAEPPVWQAPQFPADTCSSLNGYATLAANLRIQPNCGTFAQCCDLCAAMDDCTIVVYHKTSKECFLKTGSGDDKFECDDTILGYRSGVTTTTVPAGQTTTTGPTAFAWHQNEAACSADVCGHGDHVAMGNVTCVDGNGHVQCVLPHDDEHSCKCHLPPPAIPQRKCSCFPWGLAAGGAAAAAVAIGCCIAVGCWYRRRPKESARCTEIEGTASMEEALRPDNSPSAYTSESAGAYASERRTATEARDRVTQSTVSLKFLSNLMAGCRGTPFVAVGSVLYAGLTWCETHVANDEEIAKARSRLITLAEVLVRVQNKDNPQLATAAGELERSLQRLLEIMQERDAAKLASRLSQAALLSERLRTALQDVEQARGDLQVLLQTLAHGMHEENGEILRQLSRQALGNDVDFRQINELD